MTIYVDDMRAPFGKWLMSHMFSNESVAELEAFARKLGLKSAWQQNSNGFVHYDISDNKRLLAIAMGATPIEYHDLPNYAVRFNDATRT